MSMALDTATWPSPSARVEPRRLSPGEQGRVVVTIEVPDGCHLQSHAPTEPFLIPTVVQLDDVDGVTFGPPRYPEGETETFEWTSVELSVYRGVVEIAVPVEVLPAAASGTHELSGRLRYQGCTDSACLPPVERGFVARLSVAEPAD